MAKGKSLAVWGSIVALAGGVLGLVTNSETIGEHIAGWLAEDRKMDVDYIKVESQGALHCLVNNNAQFSVSEKNSIPVVKEGCFDSIYRGIDPSEIKQHGEIFRNVVFAWLKNRGKRLERVQIDFRRGDSLTIPAIDAGAERIVCLGYGGKGSQQGRDPGIVAISLYGSANDRPLKLDVRPVPSSGWSGVSSCGGTVQGYPAIEEAGK
jgi:hypothetical protein